MAIELKQQLRISQQLVMTPQLQQAIKLLQLNQQELVDLVQDELQENPCLEEDDREEATAGERSDETPEQVRAEDEARAEEPSADSEGEASSAEADLELREVSADLNAALDDPAPPSADSEVAESPSDADKIADVQWEDYMESNPQTGLEGHGRGDDDNRPSIEATLTRAPNLAEHLNWQIQLSDFSVEEVALAEWIIGNLDEKGYLKATVEEVAVQAQAEPEAVEAVLIKIQQLDPADRGLVHADIIRHIPKIQRFERRDTRFEEIPLVTNNALGDLVDRSLPLMDRLDQPHRRANLVLDIIFRGPALAAGRGPVGQHLTVYAVDLESRQALFIQQDMELPGDLVDIDIRNDIDRLVAAERAARSRLQGSHQPNGRSNLLHAGAEDARGAS